MKKKIFALFLVGMMILSLVACTGPAVSTDSERNTLIGTDTASGSSSAGTESDVVTDADSDVTTDGSESSVSDVITDSATDKTSSTSSKNPSTSTKNPATSSTDSSASSKNTSTSASGSSASSPKSLYDTSIEHKVIMTDWNASGWKTTVVVLDLNLVEQDWERLDWKQSANASAAVWKWTYSGREFCGVKYRELSTGEKYVLAVSSNGIVCIVDYKTKTTAYKLTDGSGTRSTDMNSLYNAHSAEMLPNGDLIVACSGYAETGWNYENGGLRYYKRTNSGYVFSSYLSLPFAHAVHWDPSANCLWSIGFEGIVAVKVNTQNGTMTKIASKSLKKTNFTGHDLAPAFGTDGCFWVSDNNNVYLFDSAAKTLTRSTDYPHGGIKGIAHFEDGTIMMSTWQNGLFLYVNRVSATTKGYKPYRTWVSIGTSANTRIYKIHTFTAKYE